MPLFFPMVVMPPPQPLSLRILVLMERSLGANKVNKQFSAKFNQLKEEYHQLVEEYKWNDLVYKANFSFEPIIGETYHLYTGKDGSPFLSLIGPNEWLKGKDFIGTFILNSERKFEYVLQKE